MCGFPCRWTPFLSFLSPDIPAPFYRMRYSDLVQFDPIESVVVFRESNQADKAREFVRTYAVSDEMAERLRDLLFPNLILEGNPDTRGALIVGNYGSGKSHLMAVITALAEDAALLDVVKNEVREKVSSGLRGTVQGHPRRDRCLDHAPAGRSSLAPSPRTLRPSALITPSRSLTRCRRTRPRWRT